MSTNAVVQAVEQNKSWLVRGGAIIGGIAVLAVALPVIHFAFLSTLGLVGIAITGTIGVGLIKALPWLGQKWENKLLGMRMNEARRNPIEQLQNNLVRKSNQLQVFRQGLTNIGSQIGGLETSLKDQQKKDPTEDFSDQWGALNKMKSYYETKKAAYTEAFQALEAYKKAIDRAQFKYGFGTTAQGIAHAMNDNDAKALMENMLADEAFKSADLTFNSAFAALEVESLEISQTEKLKIGNLSLDLKAIKIPSNKILEAEFVK